MTKRNYGIDLCRILSMLGIVVLHVIGKGGAQQLVNGSYTAGYWLSEWLFICAVCSVDVFAIMSGYLGVNKKSSSLYRVFELVGVVLFFCIIATSCFAIFYPEKVLNIKSIIVGLFPPMADRYWYITNFIPILIMQPFLNKMLLSLSEKQHMILCILTLSIFTILPSVIMKDFFKFNSGYSFAWLLCLYVLGAYLKRDRIDSIRIPKKYLATAFLIMSFVLLFGNMFVEAILAKNYRYFVDYNSPISLLMSISLFLLFKNLPIEKGKSLLKPLSSVAFDVYIIHGHIFIFDYIIKDLFVSVSNISIYFVIPVILLSAASIYIICAALGLMRIKLFEIFGLNRFMAKCSTAIDKAIYFDIFA